MVRIKKIAEVQIVVGKCKHEKCNKLTTFYLAPQTGSVIGIGCRHCNTILWFDNWENKIFNKMWNINTAINRNEYLKIKTQIEDEFINSLPFCPVCHKNAYSKFITNVLEQPILCGQCNEYFTCTKWVNVTNEFAAEQIFWYSDEK